MRRRIVDDDTSQMVTQSVLNPEISHHKVGTLWSWKPAMDDQDNANTVSENAPIRVSAHSSYSWHPCSAMAETCARTYTFV